MCFSATASFSTSLALIPVGIYCIKKSNSFKKTYWVFALVPLLFGIQQFLEGFVWLRVEDADSARLVALGYLFFSHLFWLIWVPFSCYTVEHGGVKRKISFVLIFVGAAYGLLMYAPLLFIEDWLTIESIQHSIVYKTVLLHDAYMPRKLVSFFYMLIILVPLLVASDRHLKILGGIILMSTVISSIFLIHAFISIWCYFAAILSLFILFMFYHKKEG